MKKSINSRFTLEQEVLLWAIRVDHTKDQRIAEILEKGVDWTYIRETGIQNGIIPLLYRRLNKEMAVLVPPDELKKLRILFLENAATNLRMTKELIRVLDLLVDVGIDAMPFKGPILAVQAYNDLSMRSYCDLDILIHKNDFDKTYETLVKAEFLPKVIVDTKTKKRIIILEKDLAFYRHNTSLEIHWQITEPLLTIALNHDHLWMRSIPIILNRREIKTLSLEDTIILICIHGTKHFWQNLKWLADLTNIIVRNPNLNWEALIERAESFGVRRILSISLYLAITHCGVESPQEIKKQLISDKKVSHLAYKIESNFFHTLNTSLFSFPPVFFFKSRERVRDQLNYSIKLFTTRVFIPDSFDFKYFLLPEYLYPLYFIIRPFRLFIGYIKSRNLL